MNCKKQILEYLELTVISTERFNQAVASKDETPTASLMEAEDDVELMAKMLERAEKKDTLVGAMVNWRQSNIQNGREVLMTLQDMVLSIYNKEIVTKIHNKFHVDIFLVEVS